jgi:hypothetical protein
MAVAARQVADLPIDEGYKKPAPPKSAAQLSLF